MFETKQCNQGLRLEARQLGLDRKFAKRKSDERSAAIVEGGGCDLWEIIIFIDHRKNTKWFLK